MLTRCRLEDSLGNFGCRLRRGSLAGPHPAELGGQLDHPPVERAVFLAEAGDLAAQRPHFPPLPAEEKGQRDEGNHEKRKEIVHRRLRPVRSIIVMMVADAATGDREQSLFAQVHSSR